MEKSNRRIALIGFAILMVGLGISDSLRGIFSGIFQTHFALTAKGLSTIIAVSYAGNLCFLLAGGRIMDRIDRKKAFLGFLAVWMCAMLVFLLTDNYYALLVGMFLAMGASTLFVVQIYTMVQKQTPPQLVGKIMAALISIAMCGQPIGQAIYGVLFDIFESRTWIVLIVAAVAAFLIAIYSKKIFSQLEDSNE